MKALLVVVIALLLVVGAIAGALLLPSGSSKPKAGGGSVELGDATLGRQVTMRANVNCIQCHSEDGSIKMGPSFRGLWGSVVKYDDGSSALLDDAAIRAALKNPAEKIVDGFEPKMPNDIDTKLNEEDRVNLLAYLHSIGARK